MESLGAKSIFAIFYLPLCAMMFADGKTEIQVTPWSFFGWCGLMAGIAAIGNYLHKNIDEALTFKGAMTTFVNMTVFGASLAMFLSYFVKPTVTVQPLLLGCCGLVGLYGMQSMGLVAAFFDTLKGIIPGLIRAAVNQKPEEK